MMVKTEQVSIFLCNRSSEPDLNKVEMEMAALCSLPGVQNLQLVFALGLFDP